MNRQEIESALDAGTLEVKPFTGKHRWWKVRRNGKTQVWKTRPEHYSIPCKAGFRDCFRIVHDTALELRDSRKIEA